MIKKPEGSTTARPRKKILYCHVTSSGHEISRMLNQERHVVQFSLAGLFPSRMAFARAARAEGALFARSDAAASNYIRDYGTADDHEGMVADHSEWEPGVLYVAPLNNYVGNRYRKLSDVLAEAKAKAAKEKK